MKEETQPNYPGYDPRTISGVINTWFIFSGKIKIQVSVEKNNLYHVYKKSLFFNLTLDGFWNNKHFETPIFTLPRYDIPYEHCRWGSCRFFSEQNHPRQGKFRNENSFGQEEIVWKGFVSIFDKDKFSENSQEKNISLLKEDLIKAVKEGLARYSEEYSTPFNNLFKHKRELLRHL